VGREERSVLKFSFPGQERGLLRSAQPLPRKQDRPFLGEREGKDRAPRRVARGEGKGSLISNGERVLRKGGGGMFRIGRENRAQQFLKFGEGARGRVRLHVGRKKKKGKIRGVADRMGRERGSKKT